MISYMIIGTIFFLLFIYLYLGASERILNEMIDFRLKIEKEKIKTLEIDREFLKKGIKEGYIKADKKVFRISRSLSKKLDMAKKLEVTYRERKIMGINLIPVAGYHLIELLKWEDVRNQYIRKVYDKCSRIIEESESMHYTRFVYGSLFGHIILGIATGFIVMGFMEIIGNDSGLIIGGGIFFMISFLGYLPYDSVNARIKKREGEIEKDFLQVVSQLTLLVVAGMEVMKAWENSSKGGRTTLYTEMTRVNIDLDNNVTPHEAFGKFITRCNNKFTTRLATAIIQNMAKGNSEIVTLFTQLNSESWSEYKHGARRMSDKVQSKLFIPTMLMFLGILILVILPVVGGFSI